MTTKYYVVLHDGVNKTDLFSSVTSVVNEMEHRPHMFVAQCTKDQVETLSDNDSIKKVVKYENDDLTITEQGNQNSFYLGTRTKSYELRKIGSFPPGQSYGPNTIYNETFPTGSEFPNTGNWGLLRHTVDLDTIQYNTPHSLTYQTPQHSVDGVLTNLAGTGVDIILNVETIPSDPHSSEFTRGNWTHQHGIDGISKFRLLPVFVPETAENPTKGPLEEIFGGWYSGFQWNTLPGMSNLPTVDYGVAETAYTHYLTQRDISEFNGSYVGTHPRPHLTVDSHAEAVAQIVGSNKEGWAYDADLYVWPRNQLGGTDGLFDNGWDCFRLFHQNKGNSRPTIVVDAISAFISGGQETNIQDIHSAVSFRNEIYGDKIAPGGVDPFPLIYWKQHNSMGGSAFGHTQVQQYAGKIPFTEGDYDARNLSEADRIAILAEIENEENYDIYETYYEPIKNMIAAGVHKISAAGNLQTTTTIPGDADYNNGSFESPGYTQSSIGNFVPFNRTSFLNAGDTITVGALSSHKEAVGGTTTSVPEVLADFSCRGDRVDIVAAGQNIYLNLRLNGLYNASGTSFASPQIAGMAALVLEKYPTTTPRQLRRFFRDHAYNPSDPTLYTANTKQTKSSIYGDVAYFQDGAGCRGYSGKIAWLDPDASQWQAIPTTLSNDPITSSRVMESTILDFTFNDINTKLQLI